MNADETDAPEHDPRQWVVNGTVENATGGGPVDFSGAQPLVNVRLHPSNMPVRCRVGAAVAGQGEGEWHPFVAGDEVLVMVPGGDERGGAVIVCRMNNGIDTWPATVANQDMTSNAFSMRRSVPNYVWEVENGWILSQAGAASGAQLALDAMGNWILADGESNFVRLSSNGIVISLADQNTSLTLNTEGQISLYVGGGSTSFNVDPSSSVFSTTGTLHLGTSGILPAQHGITVEQVVNLIANVICGLALTGAFNPLGPYGAVAWAVPTAAQTALTTLFASVIPGTVLPSPIGTDGAPGGVLDALGIEALLAVALLVPPTFGPEVSFGLSPTPYAPGIGRAALLY